MVSVLGIWIAAFLTLCIYSFLYKDNPLYKFAEHLYVGVSTGYLVVVTLGDALYRDIWEPLVKNEQKEWIVIIPTLMGCIMFLRFVKQYAWVSRISIAFIVGVAAGVSIPSNVQTYLLTHTASTMTPFFQADVSWVKVLNNSLVLLGVVTVLFYFFFSVRHEGAFKPVARAGIIYLMLFFGAAFGYTVMGRVSLLIGRMRFLLIDWLGIGGG